MCTLSQSTVAVPSSHQPSFTLRFAITLLAGLAAAVIIAPFAAYALAAAGMHFPFPRIFDRVVMITLLAAMILSGRSLGFAALMRAGFAHPRDNLGRAATGLTLGLTTMLILFILGVAVRVSPAPISAGTIFERALKYLLSAIAIGIIEEGFFRAFLLGGMLGDFGPRTALLLSSTVYALAHFVRAPAHFYLTGIHPLAGLDDLAECAAQLTHPLAGAPAMIGLTLLGMVLGRAFLLTGNVYFSIGMHGAFVLGAKTWPVIARGAAPAPRWLAGLGPVPLIGGPVAWTVAVVLLYLLPFVLRVPARNSPIPENRLGG